MWVITSLPAMSHRTADALVDGSGLSHCEFCNRQSIQMSSIAEAMDPQDGEPAARIERRPRDPASIHAMVADPETARAKHQWMSTATRHGYSYNFTWLGVPIIQLPEDIVVIQELIWSAQPDLVVETGIAYGGSLLLSASILKLLGGEREVLGIDIDIRPHARETLSTHPLAVVDIDNRGQLDRPSGHRTGQSSVVRGTIVFS